jgi:DNA-binding response OmpR family regulator
MRILVVDDELPMRVALVECLQSEGYRVRAAGDGEEALEVVFAEEFDLILLDVMMPKIDGFAACAEMRKRGVKVPVLMLTARGMVDDRVKGLDCGADDYLVKPFSLKELLARVRALLRRQERAEVPEKLSLGGTEINLRERTVTVDDGVIELNAKEVGILTLLLEFRGQVVTRDRFLDEVWGYHANPTSRTVDNFIAELRKKLGKSGSALKTVRGEGYRLD